VRTTRITLTCDACGQQETAEQNQKLHYYTLEVMYPNHGQVFDLCHQCAVERIPESVRKRTL
jgi:hypothetical protein